MTLDVLVVDDESDIRSSISDILRDEGFTTRQAADSNQTFEAIAVKVPSAIILDVWLQGSELDGLGILEVIKKQYPLMPVVVISGHGTIETAVSAIKIGAYDYIEKPFSHDKLIIVLKRAYEAARLKRENIDLRSKVIDKTEFVGNSGTTIRLKNEIERVAPTSGRVMIHGAVGSGKELTARLIHKQSKKSPGPFIVFCPTALSEKKILADFFGHVETSPLAIKTPQDAMISNRVCMLEAANNGTIYIDEIGDMPVSAQNQLLKFLRDNILCKSDGKEVKLDVRIITSTTKDLEEEIEQEKFRKDLFYRLNVVPMHVPMLADRKDDIPELVTFFVSQLVKFSGLKGRKFSGDAIAALQAYNWPGNVRQLRNVIEWTLIMNPPTSDPENHIKSDMLPQEIISDGVSIAKPDTNIDMMSMPLREAREVFERQYLSAQMNRFNNNISKTSTFVGMERSALHRKLKMLAIHATAKGEKAPSSEKALEQV